MKRFEEIHAPEYQRELREEELREESDEWQREDERLARFVVEDDRDS